MGWVDVGRMWCGQHVSTCRVRCGWVGLFFGARDGGGCMCAVVMVVGESRWVGSAGCLGWRAWGSGKTDYVLWVVCGCGGLGDGCAGLCTGWGCTM